MGVGAVAERCVHVQVRASGPTGQQSAVVDAPFTVNVAASPPGLSLVSGPAEGSTVSSSWAAAAWFAPGAECYRYEWDGADADLSNLFCGTGSSYASDQEFNLADGEHVLRVQARSTGGSYGPVLERRFTVASGALLSLSLVSGPAEGSTVSSSWAAAAWFAPGAECYRFEWDGTDADLGNLFCGTGSSYASDQEFNLADGEHVLRVQARSTGGSYGPVLERRFTVASGALLSLSLVSGPAEGSTISSSWAAAAWFAPGAECYRYEWDGADADLSNLFCGTGSSYASDQEFNLADGEHVLRVQARSTGGSYGPVLERRFTVASGALLSLSLVSGPAEGSTISSSWAAAAWFAPGAECYRYEWDGADADLSNLFCGTGSSYASDQEFNLADGEHVLRVQARSTGGSYGPVLERTFTVAGGPFVSVWSQPRLPLPTGVAAMSWSAPGATCYRYEWDGTDDDLGNLFCGSGASYSSSVRTDLPNGTHVLRVQARTSGGSYGPVTTVTFQVGTQPPETTFTQQPSSPSNSSSATFAFSSPASGTFECSLDGAAFAACTSPTTLEGLAVGPHTFAARAVDLFGNPDPTPVSLTWEVTNTPVNTPPSATLSVDTAQGGLPLPVTFTLGASDPDDDELSWQLETGDGAPAQTGTGMPPATVSHTYTRSGVFTARLIVDDGAASVAATTKVTTALSEPLSADAGDDRLVAPDEVVEFDAGNSRPTIGIDSVQWNFGDGATSSQQRPTHTYAAPGTYTVTLTVTAGGATDVDEATVTVVAPQVDSGLFVTVRSGAAPVVGADVLVIDSNGTRISATSDGDGLARLLGLPDGELQVYVFAEGKRPANVTASVIGGRGDVSVDLDDGAIGVTSVESRRLELQEIIDLGIDPNDPDNQNIFEFEAVLYFCDPTCTDPVTFDVSGFARSGGPGSLVGTPGITCSDPARCDAVRIIPGVSQSSVTEAPLLNFLVIPGKARFLKEFFEVKMLIANLAPPGITLEDGAATLALPTGLSLAPTAQEQTATQDVGTIAGGATAQSTWIVRGDVEGEYDLSAGYTGTLQPFDRSVSLFAETAEPLKVWGGSALEMTVQADQFLTQYAPYRVRIGLRNVSDIPVYNPSVELIEDGRFGYIYQARQQLEYGTARVEPGQTFWTDQYVLMPWIPGGELDLERSFVRKTAGNVELASEIITQPSPATRPDISAEKRLGGGTVEFEPIPGAVRYEAYTTRNADTPNGPQPDVAFGTVPAGSTDVGSADELELSADGVNNAEWVGISTLFADGSRQMLHPLTPLPGIASPVGVPDAYTTDRDSTLVVPAPGVLDNDTAVPDDEFIAELEEGPAEGELELATDGGFTYTPPADFVGEQSFTYRAVSAQTGQSAPTTVTITVEGEPNENVAPTAAFGALPTSGTAPMTVNADASSSSDSDGQIVTYEWDFGNGDTATGITASSTYTEVGTYTITLVVTDDDGATASATEMIVVDPPQVVTDRVGLQVVGARSYQYDGPVTSGNLRVIRDAFGISRVVGAATYPGVNGGAATVNFTLNRFLIFNAFIGQSVIRDSSVDGMTSLTGIAFLSPLSSPSSSSARGTLQGFVDGRNFTVRFTVDDRA